MDQDKGSDQLPVEVGEYVPVEVPVDTGNQSGGEWQQKHPA